MGGHFASYVLFRYPEVFQKILIGAPPFQLGNMKEDAVKFFKVNDSLHTEVFVGVGAYETQVVQNIKDFENYLNVNNHGIKAGFRVTPDAGHGAGISQVMEDAIAFAYCKKHTRIGLSKSELQKFTGSYSNDKRKDYLVNITLENGKLYFNDPVFGTNEILAFKSNGFFMQVNETFEIVFEDEKMHSVFPGGKWSFTKVK
jgi:hypothetical protein